MKLKIILFLFLISCVTLQAQNPKWEEQLDAIMVTSNIDSLVLLKYIYVGEVNTDTEVENMKKILLSKENYIPFDGDYLKMKDIKYKSLVQHYLNKTSQYFDMKFSCRMEQVKLLWKYGNMKFESICVIGDDSIIFDHILMNSFTFKEKEKFIESSEF